MKPFVKISVDTRFMKQECEHDWELLQPIAKGRFCDSCQKPVYDFTNWEREQIRSFYKDHPTVCGLFRAEQIDTSLRPIDLSFLQIRARHLLIPLLAFIGLPDLKAQDNLKNKVNTEISADSSGNSKVSKKNPKTEDKNASAAINTDSKNSVNPKVASETKSKKRLKRLYWSKRFPFIHKRSKFVGGCPRF